MKYKTKIYLGFLAVSTLSVLGGIGYLYTKAASELKFELRTKVVSVAATAAALINPDDVQIVSETLDIKNPAFSRLQKQLLEARDNNRRPDLFVKYIYILRPETPNSEQMIFLIEAENAVLPNQKDTQQSQSKIYNHLGEFYSPNRFIFDKFGTWMSGFAPIFDENGHYIATLGVDISALSVDKALNQMIYFALFALIVSLFCAYSIAYYLAHKMTRALEKISHCLDQVASGDFSTRLNIVSDDEFTKLGHSLNQMAIALKESQALKLNFSKYVSKYVMDQILTDQSQLKLQGERKKITVLFSDIRHFTQISENMTPESVVALLNEYFEVMLQIIFKYNGTIDKFMGDGIMAEFGAPLADSEQEIHAAGCALEMLQELERLNIRFKQEGRPELSIGIGIHTGFAIMGNIGSEKRMDYTAIGDCVNVASRLEQATKTYNAPLLVSEETYRALGEKFKGTSIGSITLSGRTKEIKVYALKV